MNKLIVPSLIAALAVFIWGSISWMVLSWHDIDLNNFPDETEIMHMKAVVHEPGIYVYPGQPTDETDAGMEEWIKQYEAGPVISFMVYSPAGFNPMNPMLFIKSFIINFIAAFIAGALMMMTLAQKPGFWRRVIFVMLLGLFAGFIGPFSEWNWWNFPTGYTLVNVADFCVTWFIAGLILAWRIKPEANLKTT